MLICKDDLSRLLKTKYKDYDAIVVEGYDGVGKGNILNSISSILEVTPYRPDYNLWDSFDHRKSDRWKVSGFFLDVYSHFHIHTGTPLLFDRGVISGAVYNDDDSIATHYKDITRDMKILHILVECLHDDYVKFWKIRGESISDELIEEEWEKCCIYSDRYLRMLNLSGADFVILLNSYDTTIATTLEKTCEGCGHYSYGWCRHPVINCPVAKDHVRCNLSKEREVQDIDAAKMYCLQSE